MRLKLVEHYNKENGDFISYELQYKPFWWWPVWRKFGSDRLVKNASEIEHDIVFTMILGGSVSVAKDFN